MISTPVISLLSTHSGDLGGLEVQLQLGVLSTLNLQVGFRVEGVDDWGLTSQRSLRETCGGRGLWLVCGALNPFNKVPAEGRAKGWRGYQKRP